jgi:hypothetical protein
MSSPYFFLARYEDKQGHVAFDSVKNTYNWLTENPQSSVELITNSALTSDNFLAQAVIDMDTAPRLLLSPEQQEQWLSGLEEGEFNSELVESEEWKRGVAIFAKACGFLLANYKYFLLNQMPHGLVYPHTWPERNRERTCAVFLLVQPYL